MNGVFLDRTHSYLAALDHLRNGSGPTSNTFSAVPANVNEGVFVLRQTSWEVFTRICTQCVQMNPTTSVPISPNKYPELRNAKGIAKIPLPSELFSKWISDPVVLLRVFAYSVLVFNFILYKSYSNRTYEFGFSTTRWANGSYSASSSNTFSDLSVSWTLHGEGKTYVYF